MNKKPVVTLAAVRLLSAGSYRLAPGTSIVLVVQKLSSDLASVAYAVNAVLGPRRPQYKLKDSSGGP